MSWEISYEAFRHFADSYGLAAMVVLYLILCGWVFLPRSRRGNERARQMIFDEDQ
ncbi:MAG: cbb3-type cytochrome c oxidase subunit 3 [Pacificimonas sp.]|jgi:cytochrome c oxidase cbb3-type subunit 4|nr:cbb3-type cytochrome c oxidase subunit 3 [Pacificimonas sp.]